MRTHDGLREPARHSTPVPTAQETGGRDSVIFYAADEPHEKVGTKPATCVVVEFKDECIVRLEFDPKDQV